MSNQATRTAFVFAGGGSLGAIHELLDYARINFLHNSLHEL
jgi:hypothetical protein